MCFGVPSGGEGGESGEVILAGELLLLVQRRPYLRGGDGPQHMQHLVRVTAERQQTLRRLKDLRRIVVDDLRCDHLVDDQMQPRVDRHPVHAQLCAILCDRLVEIGVRQADQRDAIVRVMGSSSSGCQSCSAARRRARSSSGGSAVARRACRLGPGEVTRRR